MSKPETAQTYFRHPDPGPKDGRNEVNGDDRALRLRHVDLAEAQRAGHVRLPVGTVEQGHRAKALEEHPPRVEAQLDGDARRKGHEHGRDRVTAVVEQLPEGRRRVCPAGLLAVDGVQTLVHKQTQRAQGTRPPGRLGAAIWTVAEGGKREKKKKWLKP